MIKMSYFKEFCESIHKTDTGHVPDLLDLENDHLRDLAMACFLEDKLGAGSGSRYMNAASDKTAINDIYAHHESACQDAIDAYNQTIDDAREKAKSLELIDDHMWISMLDPDYKYRRFNQAEIDAGFSGTGREFC
jgi:hypothetical protein